MRCYFFGNMYLSSIQQGIQAAHVVSEMFLQYQSLSFPNEHEQLLIWSDDHKTMILLNGGYGSNLHELEDFFDHVDNPYPFASFKESHAALDNAITSVGIVLPEKIYEGCKIMNIISEVVTENVKLVVKDDVIIFTPWEVELMQRLNKFRLAN